LAEKGIFESKAGVVRFVSIPVEELPADATYEDLVFEAARRRYRRPSLCESLSLPAHFTALELGYRRHVLCHEPITLPRVNNPDQVRPYCLELVGDPNEQIRIALLRVQQQRFLSDQYTYVLVQR